MGKLFNLREWLTVAEAARHLTSLFGEEVVEADVLRLALDGRLTLSVNFINHATARKGRIVTFTDAELLSAIESGVYPEHLKWSDIGAQVEAMKTGIPAKEKPELMLLDLRIAKDKYLTLEDKISSISGVWDMAMIGGEKLDVEHQYQLLTDGPCVTLSTLDGSFVQREDGVTCQLQTCMDDNEYSNGSLAQLEKLRRYIVTDRLSEDLAAPLLAKHAAMRVEYLQIRSSGDPLNDHYPADGLPEDCVWVVRTKSIRELMRTLGGAPEHVEKPVGTRERGTFLSIIASLAKINDLELSQPYKAAESVRLGLELIGRPLDTETIVAKLKEAATLIR